MRKRTPDHPYLFVILLAACIGYLLWKANGG